MPLYLAISSQVKKIFLSNVSSNKSFIICLILAIFLTDLLTAFNIRSIGHDYGYLFIPNLLNGLIQFKAQGFSIPWYSPIICPGSVVFGNPQSFYYSLPQILTYFTSSWTSIRITNAIMIAIAGYGARKCAKDIFSFSSSTSSTIGVLFATNGFLIARIIVGHFNYSFIALTPILIFLIFSKNISNLFSILCISALSVILVHSGAYLATFSILLSLPLCISLLFLDRGKYPSVKAICIRCVGGVVGYAISFSKLVAIQAYTDTTPRILESSEPTALSSLIYNLFNQLFIPTPIPQGYSSWEFSCLLHPAILIGICCLFTRKNIISFFNRTSLIRLSNFILSCVLILSFIKNSSLVHDIFHILGYGDMRISVRFTSALIFPLILIGMYGISKHLSKNNEDRIHDFIRITSLYLLMLVGLINHRAGANFDISQLASAEKIIRETRIEDLSPQNILEGYTNSIDLKNILNPAKHCYDSSIIGLNLYDEIIIGEAPMNITQFNQFNFVKPQCLAYPEENNCSRGDHFSISEADVLSQFLKFRVTPGEISHKQKIANKLSFYSFLIWCLVGAINLSSFIYNFFAHRFFVPPPGIHKNS